MGRLIDSYVEGVIDRDAFQPCIAGLKGRLARMASERQASIEAAEAERSLALVVGRMAGFAAKARRRIGELDWQGTREIIRSLVRRIEIDGNAVEIVFPIPPLPQGHEPRGQGSGPERPTDRQHCGSVHRSWVREYPDHMGAPLDLTIQPLEGVDRGDLRAVLFGERTERQHIVLRPAHQLGCLREPFAQAVGDHPVPQGREPQGGSRGRHCSCAASRRALREDGARERGYHRPLARWPAGTRPSRSRIP